MVHCTVKMLINNFFKHVFKYVDFIFYYYIKLKEKKLSQITFKSRKLCIFKRITILLITLQYKLFCLMSYEIDFINNKK